MFTYGYKKIIDDIFPLKFFLFVRSSNILACQNNHLDIVQWLIEKNHGDIDDMDYMHNTPLHYAAAGGNEHIIHYLLDKKAKVVSNNDGNTPLHIVNFIILTLFCIIINMKFRQQNMAIGMLVLY